MFMVNSSLGCKTIVDPFHMSKDFVSFAAIKDSLEEIRIANMQLPWIDADDWS